jgi:hypothetical protein
MAGILLGVGMPYFAANLENHDTELYCNRAHRVEEFHGLILVDGEKAPLTCRCSLQVRLDSDNPAMETILTRAKDPTFLTDASICGRW